MSDLVALVPYALGFYPSDSVVVVPLSDAVGHVMAFARVDVVPLAQRAAAASAFAEILAQHSPAAAVVLAYGGRDAEAQASAQVAALDEVGVPVHAAVVCAGETWRQIGEDQWHPVESCSRVVVEAVAQGKAPLASRQEKVELLARLDPSPEYVTALASPPVFAGVAASHAWAQVLDPSGPAVSEIDPDVLATAVAALEVGVFRDVLLAVLAGVGRADDVCPFGPAVTEPLTRVVPQPMDRAALARLVMLCRITPDAAAASLCAVVGVVAWVTDGTVLAQEAADRALTCDPSHQLAGLLDISLSRGLNPRDLQRRFV